MLDCLTLTEVVSGFMVVGVGAQAGEFSMDQSLAEAHITMRLINTNPNPLSCQYFDKIITVTTS